MSIRSAARFSGNVAHCYLSQSILPQALKTNCSKKLTFRKSETLISNMFKSLKKKFPELVIIEPMSVQCTKKRCQSSEKGVPLYRDAHHLNDYGSNFFGEKYFTKNENFLEKLN